MDYAVNRHYDSQQGRFTQVDPIGVGGSSLGSPQSFNLYSYVGNDPINHLDPSGLFWGKLFKWINKALKWVGIAILVAVVVLNGPFSPASGTVLAHILGFLIHLGAIIGSAMNFVAGGVLLAEGGTAASAAILGASGLLLASTGVGAVAKQQQKKQQKEKDGCTPKDCYSRRSGRVLDNLWSGHNATRWGLQKPGSRSTILWATTFLSNNMTIPDLPRAATTPPQWADYQQALPIQIAMDLDA